MSNVDTMDKEFEWETLQLQRKKLLPFLEDRIGF